MRGYSFGSFGMQEGDVHRRYTCTQHAHAHKRGWFSISANRSIDQLNLLIYESGATPNTVLLHPGRLFTIECTGDVVVGDTILFTEQVPEKGFSGEREGREAHGEGEG